VSEPRRYRWASLIIECDLPLPELTPVADRRRHPPDVVIRHAAARTLQGRRTLCHEWKLPDGTRWASISKRRGEHVLRFRRFAEFIVGEGGRSVRWRAPAATRPHTIRHLLLDQVLPALAFEHSLIGLHASAVVVDGQGIAFAGPASQGKSTLAASFALDGHAILTDDCLMIQWKRREPRAVPSYPSLRLWTGTANRLLGSTSHFAPVAEYTSKLRVGARVSSIAFHRRPVAVRRIYLIDRRKGSARIDLLPPRQAYIELLKIAFRLDPLDPESARREMEALAALAQCVQVARLRVPMRLESLGHVRRVIAADLCL
jgi:hypothetical protein